MTVHLSFIDAETLLIQMGEETPEGDLTDFTTELKAGEEFHGWTYEDLRALGEGEHEIDEK